MEVLLIMVVGAVVGATIFPARLKGLNDKLTLIFTVLLIFSMGAGLGGRESFLDEVATLGALSLLFCLVPTLFSTLAVYGLTRLFMSDIAEKNAGPKTAQSQETFAQSEKGSSESIMAGLALAALVLGGAYGLAHLAWAPVDMMVAHSEWLLYVLLFLVGIVVGSSRGLVGKLRQYHVRVLIVPFGVVLGSVIGGLVCAPIAGVSLPVGGAIASGLGWYSLSGVMLTEIAGAQLGGVTFMANLLRELVSFFSIPFIARYMNYPTCIAPCAATSEDTTLPMLIKCTNGETVVLGVVNGVICSALVPVLIELFHQFM